MERVRYVEHEGERILLTDLSDLVEGEILETIVAASKEIRSHPHGTLLTLTDATNARLTLRKAEGDYDRTAVETIRATLAGNTPHVKAAAIVVDRRDTQRILVDFFNRVSHRRFEMFDSTEAALDWLASCE